MGDARARIALFDNIKGLLIILVVAGHFMHPVHNDNEVMSALFDIIYLFHMPLFIFLSGLFAKGAYREGRLNVNRIISFLVLGFAYQAALLAINGVLVEHPERMMLFTSAPWYLIGMAWWYLATPLLAHTAPPIGMLACLVAAMTGGMVDLSNGLLAVSRSLAFLPYFALGYYCSPDTLRKLADRRMLWLAVASAAGIAALRIVDPHAFDWFFQMVYGDNSYALAGSVMGLARGSAVAGIAAKLVTIAIAVVFSLAVLKAVPREHSKLTTLGERTLQVYVLHRLLRAALTFRTPFYDLAILLDPLWGTAIILALSGGVVVLCALRLFTMPFSRLMAKEWLPGRLHEGNRHP
ncbi:acyltransferase family protein [Enorma phocaeensis]|uniref:Acyltransferase family protein n=1 Tax=Enorma phocaeensis TaxID=1871019 RepID=A0A921LUL8_9ACTN|nr:acyltransferase family protein [Enorma phocaeensis]HJG37922.1 acyltransferase family protein [Enorma phocaeensis]